MAADRHVGFSKFDIFNFHLTVVFVRLCLLIPILALIGQYGAEL